MESQNDKATQKDKKTAKQYKCAIFNKHSKTAAKINLLGYYLARKYAHQSKSAFSIKVFYFFFVTGGSIEQVEPKCQRGEFNINNIKKTRRVYASAQKSGMVCSFFKDNASQKSNRQII